MKVGRKWGESGRKVGGKEEESKRKTRVREI
jgi:hypothetical protein